jgi:drug/metabolite transporter (DMT)-like permease
MAPETPSSAGSLDLPPGFAQRIRRGSVAMSINLIVAAVILGGGSIVEASINLSSPGPNRSWVIYFGVLPALLMVVLALHMLRVRGCLDGDRLELDKVEQLRPGLRMWWIAVVVSALVVIMLILVLDFLAHTNSSGSAIIGALPPFLTAVVANTSYGTSKSWLNPKLD